MPNIQLPKLDYQVQITHEKKDLRRIIEQLTEDKAKEIGISRRMYYYLKKKVLNNEKIKLKDKTIKKINTMFHKHMKNSLF